MSKYPFAFSAVIYFNYDNNTQKTKYVREQGMGFADSFAQAASIIENYYGSDLINIQKLELFEETDILLMPQAHIDEYRQRDLATEVIPIFHSCDVNGDIYD